MNWIFGLFQTGILQATQAVNIKFKLGKKSSSSNSIFQTGILQKSSADRYGYAQLLLLPFSLFPIHGIHGLLNLFT